MTVNKLGHADLEGMTAEGGTLVNVQQVTIERMDDGEFAITILKAGKDAITISLHSSARILGFLTHDFSVECQIKDSRFEISPTGRGELFCVLDHLIPSRAYVGDYESCEHFIHEQSKCLLDHTA